MGEADGGGTPPKRPIGGTFSRWGARVGGGIVFIAVLRLIVLVLAHPDRVDHDLVIFLNVVLGSAVILLIASWVFTLLWYRSRVLVQRLAPAAFVIVARSGIDFQDALAEASAAGWGEPPKRSLGAPVISVDDDGVTVWYGRKYPRPGVMIAARHIVSVGVGRRFDRRFVPAVEMHVDVAGSDVVFLWSVQRFGVLGARIGRGKYLDEVVTKFAARATGQPTNHAGT